MIPLNKADKITEIMTKLGYHADNDECTSYINRERGISVRFDPDMDEAKIYILNLIPVKRISAELLPEELKGFFLVAELFGITNYGVTEHSTVLQHYQEQAEKNGNTINQLQRQIEDYEFAHEEYCELIDRNRELNILAKRYERIINALCLLVEGVDL